MRMCIVELAADVHDEAHAVEFAVNAEDEMAAEELDADAKQRGRP
jgi:hypothetical protein